MVVPDYTTESSVDQESRLPPSQDLLYCCPAKTNMGLLIIIESLLALAAVVILWRRSRPVEPPYGAAAGWVALVLFVQSLLKLVIFLLLNYLYTDPATVEQRLPSAAWGVWAVQMARAASLIFALALWFRIVKPRLIRSWRGVALAIAFTIIAVVPDAAAVGSVLIIIVLLRLKWTEKVSGWRRFAGFLITLVLFVSTNAQVTTRDTPDDLPGTQFSMSSGPSINVFGEDVPESAAGIVQITEPWETVVRTTATLFRWQILIACVQFLVFPIRLRGLSLKRRFTVTMILYRVIPGLLGFAAVVLGIYFGFGLHKTRMAQEAFGDTLDRNLHAAQLIVNAAVKTGWPGTANDDGIRAAFEDAGHWSRGGSRTHFVLKQVALREEAPEDSTDAARMEVDSVLSYVSTENIPDKFVRSDLFRAGAIDSVAGVAVADTILFLAAARAVRNGNEAIVAEVYSPIDVTYLRRISELVHTDVRFRAIPDMFIGESQVTVGGQVQWADSSFVVEAALEDKDSTGRGFWHEPHFLGRSYVPISNWNAPLDGVSGAAELTLSVSPQRLLSGVVSNQLVFSSNAIAVLIFLSILILFLIAEYSAARTGRSIIRGILDDVKGLAEAAKRFGEGDLSHRIEVRGKDELGSLSASFNTMAQNIEENQELLLEKERLEADLALARDIQQRMLPQSPPVLPGLDVAGISIPSREVGGDLFYFLPVPEGRLGLTIGDVSGKSVPAALLMSNVLAALKTEARLVEQEDEILTHLNRLIVEQVEPGRFVTFFYGVVDRNAMRLSYACAGHNPPLLVSPDGKSEWLREAGVPLGVLPDYTYTPADHELGVDDVLVLYSDGVTEAERPSVAAAAEAEPEFFDDHRLEQAVLGARGKSASEIVQSVADAVRDFTGGADLSDDLTLVVVKIVD
jgi:serine phosphatase RsbU (regulator of sigma subunit)